MKGIEKRGENTYRFTVSLGRGADGKYKRERKTYTVQQKFTPKRLKEHLKHEYLKFKNEVESGNYISPQKMTFEAFVSEWRKKFADNGLSETTLTGHLTRLDVHILPVIGHLDLDKINSMILLDLMSNLTRKDGKEGPLSIHTKEDVYKTLKSVFKYAVQWRILTNDPMEGVDKPRDTGQQDSDLNVYEPEEVTALFESVQDELFHWRVFLSLAITAGLRRGESLGLEWSDVDFENSRIEIKDTIVRGRNGPLIKSPKTRTSRRLVTLPPFVMEELKQYRVHWLKERLRMGDRWTEKDREWLFCNEDGSHFYPTTPTTWWKRFTERAGVRFIRLHDLRHTSVTLLIAQQVHMKVISERLGHSKINITMDQYGHVLKSADQAAADTFQSLYKPKKDIN